MESVYVGIDISKEYLDVAIHNSNQQQRFANDPGGIASLCRMLIGFKPALVVFEATGGYEMPLYLALDEASLPASPVNPRQIRDFAKSTGKLAKTDLLDARVLAHFGFHSAYAAPCPGYSGTQSSRSQASPAPGDDYRGKKPPPWSSRSP